MDGQAHELLWIAEANVIEVPFFQRPYVWETEHFDALIESFVDAPGNTMPFFGSVILKEVREADEGNFYLIIDGQQRVTTFNVLIRALLDVNMINSINLAPSIVNKLTDAIYNIEIDDEGNEHYKNKLVPSNPDKDAFELVMDPLVDRPLDLDDSVKGPIVNAYKYFYTYFSNADKETVKRFGLKLHNKNKSLIFIILDKNDDEQKIFDSVNSLGKTLSNSDIVKNYLFQRMKELSRGDSIKEKQVIENYYKYWDSIFYANSKKEFWYNEFTVGRITTDHLECFLKDLAIVKKIYAAKKTTGIYGLCNAYKEYIDTLSLDALVAFLKEINEYAKVYYDYKYEYSSMKNFVWSDYVNRTLLILDYLETSTFNPYILKLLKEKPDDIEQRFYRFEKFFLERFIYEGTTKNYNQCCEGLINASNDEIYFKEYMKESPVGNVSYKTKFRKLTNKQGVLFLFLLEMLHRAGNEDKYSDALNISAYSLEHVMPQKWQSNDEWMKLDSYDEAGNLIDKNNMQQFIDNRNAAMRSLGNFALLTAKLNASVSNASFEIKINGNGKKNGIGMRGFAAALHITKSIIDTYDEEKVWNEKNIFTNEAEHFEVLNNFYQFK